MYKLLVSILICILLPTSCSKDDNAIDNRTYEYFNSNLKAEMTYSQITSTFGEPITDKGSGIHIYVYSLNDNTQNMDRLHGSYFICSHLDSNGRSTL